MGNREYWLGCDLGRRVDRTAIVVVEAMQRHTLVHHGEPVQAVDVYNRTDGWHTAKQYANVTERRDDVFEVARILRMDAGTPFDEVVDALCEFDAAFEPKYAWVDATGLGAGLMDMLRVARQQGRLRRRYDGLVLTAENKLDLMSGLDRVITEGRIRVPDQPGADKLRQELRDFHRGYTPRGNVTMGAVTESAHDDLAIATALAVYPTVLRRRVGGLSGFYGTAPACRIVQVKEYVDA